MGPPHQLLRWFPQRRTEAAVLVQIQLLVQAWRLDMMNNALLRGKAWIAGVAAAAAIAGFTPSARQAAADPQAVVNAAFEKYKDLKEGKNADYIPALAKVNPDLYGIALYT